MENAAASRGKPFAAGNRASPGRPRGARNRETVALEALLRKEAREVVAAVVLMAKAGSVPAARLVMERLMVPPKDRTVTIDLGAVATLADLDAAHGVVLAEVCAGSITCAEGTALAGMLEAKRRLLDQGDLDRRITELEGKKKP